MVLSVVHYQAQSAEMRTKLHAYLGPSLKSTLRHETEHPNQYRPSKPVRLIPNVVGFSTSSRARSRGNIPRRSATPCSVTMISMSCSVWSACGTIGTMREMSSLSAVDGKAMTDSGAFRGKSPLPPTTLSIFDPVTCVELTYPWRLTSSALLTATTPKQSMSEAQLETSAGRRTTSSA